LIENIASIESVKFLVEKSADVDLEDDDGMTPLMHAVRNNQVEVVEYLLTKKADVNIPDKVNY
jgi:ankyrin repeat protein